MPKSISFCTTCCNRLWQLKQTLPQNLEALNKSHEIVLVDYGSTDHLSEWVWANFKSHIENKTLCFFEVKNEVRWNVARAKNLAHRLASGGYLFNLDADNFMVKKDVELIENSAKQGFLTHQWSKVSGDGSFGRIGTSREKFLDIGGYDETLLGMGGQDVDIINRLYVVHNKQIVNLDGPSVPAVKNTFDDKIKEISPNGIPIKDAETAYTEMNKLNLAISKYKIKNEGPVRMGGGFSYKGLLNGERVSINGFDEIMFVPS